MKTENKRRFKKPLNGESFTTIYIGNLVYSKSEGAIKKLFTPYGKVINVKIVLDQETQRSKGIAFVQMTQIEDATEAIKSLNGKKVDGRTLKVSIAQERNNKVVAKVPRRANKEEPTNKKKPKKRKVKGLDILFDYLGK